jgi:hypothetical protein
VLPDFEAERDRLADANASMLGWTGSIRGTGRAVAVDILLGGYWPEIAVRLRIGPSGPIQVSGVFNSAGRLHLVQFEGVDDHEITTADLRWGGILHALKEWEIVGRQVATQILNGVPLDKAVFDAQTPAEALRILDQAGRRQRPRKIRRRGEREELIRQVAAAYREEVAAGNSRPRVALAERFGYTPQHIGALLVEARKPRNGQPPLLGPAQPGKAGEDSANG